MQQANAHLTTALEAITKNTLATYIAPFATLVYAQILLTQGDLTQAEARFSEAYQQAEAQQTPLLATDAVLGLAQTRLAREELDAALSTFLEAGRQYQLLESVGGDGVTMLGLAQVNLGRERWDEALENSEAALLRLNQAHDQIGVADTLLTQGLAQRGKDELEAALEAFEQALHMYHQQRRPLGVADVRSARAGIFLLRSELDRAGDEQTLAITQVENVMRTLSTPQAWGIFLRQYAELYAQTAITLLRNNQSEQATTVLQNFARIAGGATLVHHLQLYEASIPTSGDDLTEEELRANTALVTRLRQAHKGLS
jgi:tetratricopeptide (TPR) repeat protein